MDNRSVPSNPPASSKESASLWTTPVAASRPPLDAAKIDRTVSREELEAAIAKAQAKRAAFAAPVTAALLRKST